MGAKVGRIGRREILLATTALALVLAGPAVAAPKKSAGAAPAVSVAQADNKTYAFDIPARPLPEAMAAFAAATGLQVLYTERSTYSHQAPAVKGTLTATEALRQLLAGSGLDGRLTASGTVTVARSAIVTGGGSAINLAPIEIYGSKTATTLDDTTASVAVVTAEEIEQRQLGSFREAFRVMGNVMDADWPDAGFVIRGVNSEGLTPGRAPLASVYADGAQQTSQGARRGARGLWDVEQVEVYRGPQSTLTGRAALAGALYVKTKDPTFKFESAAQATVGTLDTRGGAFAVGGPVVDDQVAFRISGEYEVSESDLNYPTYRSFRRYEEFVEDEYYQLRGKLLLLPRSLPDSSALLTYSFSHDSPNADDIAGPVLGFTYGQRRGDFNTPVFSESRSADTHNLSLDLGHNVTSGLKLTSLSTYSFTDMRRPSVNEGTPGETNYTNGRQEEYVAAQEFRANYETDRWKGVLGVYIAKENAEQGYERPANFGRNDVSRGARDTFNAAAFGEVTYTVVPTWKIVAGGRVDYTDETSMSYFSRNSVVTTNRETTFQETVLLPKAGLIKELTPDHTLGVTAQRGFRSGGSGVQSSAGLAYTFDPEYAWTYEASYKGKFLGGRLQAGVNLFTMDWTDQQVEVQEVPGSFASTRVTNAAKSSTKGFEIETRYQMAEGLSTFASIGYVHTRFDSFSDASLGNVSGMPFPEAPHWNAALGAFYQHPSGFFVGGDAKYISRSLARFGTLPHDYLDGYMVANAQLGYRLNALTIRLFAENLFDEEYFVYTDRSAAGDIAATLGRRQMIGLSTTLKF